MKCILEFLAETFQGLLISLAIAVAIIISACSIYNYTDIQDKMSLAEKGLQQCIYYNGPNYYKVWQRDCSQK